MAQRGSEGLTMARRGRDLFLSAILLVTVVAGLGIWKQFFGAEVGISCSTGRDCRYFNSRCLVTPIGDYCTRGCKSDSDCPIDWRCTEAQWHSRKDGAATGDTERLCMKPMFLRRPPK
jgi:hypothetical protein